MPPRRRAAAPVIRALPLEVYASIVQHSLPPVAFETFDDRYYLLRMYLEVNKQWSQIAQRELHRHVKVGRGDRAAAYLQRAVNGRPDEQADAAKMETLYIGCYGNDASFPILHLLLVCPKLTELHLINIQSLDAATISVAVGKLLLLGQRGGSLRDAGADARRRAHLTSRPRLDVRLPRRVPPLPPQPYPTLNLRRFMYRLQG